MRHNVRRPVPGRCLTVGNSFIYGIPRKECKGWFSFARLRANHMRGLTVSQSRRVCICNDDLHGSAWSGLAYRSHRQYFDVPTSLRSRHESAQLRRAATESLRSDYPPGISA